MSICLEHVSICILSISGTFVIKSRTNHRNSEKNDKKMKPVAL